MVTTLSRGGGRNLTKVEEEDFRDTSLWSAMKIIFLALAACGLSIARCLHYLVSMYHTYCALAGVSFRGSRAACERVRCGRCFSLVVSFILMAEIQQLET